MAIGFCVLGANFRLMYMYRRVGVLKWKLNILLNMNLDTRKLFYHKISFIIN